MSSRRQVGSGPIPIAGEGDDAGAASKEAPNADAARSARGNRGIAGSLEQAPRRRTVRPAPTIRGVPGVQSRSPLVRRFGAVALAALLVGCQNPSPTPSPAPTSSPPASTTAPTSNPS